MHNINKTSLLICSLSLVTLAFIVISISAMAEDDRTVIVEVLPGGHIDDGKPDKPVAPQLINVLAGTASYDVMKFSGQEATNYELPKKEADGFHMKVKPGKTTAAKLDIYTDKAQTKTIKVDKVKDTQGKDEYVIPFSDFIKLGTSTIIIEKLSAQTVDFSIDTRHNISAYCDKDFGGTWSRMPEVYWVHYDDNSWGWGLNDSYSTGWEHYRCYMTSDLPIKDNKFVLTDSISVAIDVSNITSVENSSLFYDNNATTIIIDFNSTGFFDPVYSYSFGYGQLGFENATQKNGTTIVPTTMQDRPWVNLTGYWNFDSDMIPNVHVNGVVGKALNVNFTTANALVANTPTLQITKNLTISLWVYATSNAARQSILYKDFTSEYEIVRETTGDMTFYCGNGTAYGFTLSKFLVGANRWVHVVVVRNNTHVSYFINGTLQTVAKLTVFNIRTSNNPVYIGSRANTAPFGGMVDEVKIWNTALTALDVSNIYGNESTGVGQKYPTTNITIDLPFNETEGSFFNDVSGNGLNATGLNLAFAKDFSANDNTGVYTGYAYNTPNSLFNDGAYFDKRLNGGNNQIYIGRTASLNNIVNQSGTFNGMTICAWVNITTTELGIENAIVAKSNAPSTTNGAWMFDLNGVKLDFEKSFSTTVLDANSGSSANGSVKAGTWTHVCMVWNGSASLNSVSFYVNASYASAGGTAAVGNMVSDSGQALYISASSSRWFNGTIDEVMIFNTTLNATEISNIYTMTAKRFQNTSEMLTPTYNNSNNALCSGTTCNRANFSLQNFEANNGSYIRGEVCTWDESLGYAYGNYRNNLITLRPFNNSYLNYAPLLITNYSAEWQANAGFATNYSFTPGKYGTAVYIGNNTYMRIETDTTTLFDGTNQTIHFAIKTDETLSVGGGKDRSFISRYNRANCHGYYLAYNSATGITLYTGNSVADCASWSSNYYNKVLYAGIWYDFVITFSTTATQVWVSNGSYPQMTNIINNGFTQQDANYDILLGADKLTCTSYALSNCPAPCIANGCEGTITDSDCNQLTGQGQEVCEDTDSACQWYPFCTDAPAATCDTTDMQACNALGCNENCTGDFTPCDTYSELDCPNHYGCEWDSGVPICQDIGGRECSHWVGDAYGCADNGCTPNCDGSPTGQCSDLDGQRDWCNSVYGCDVTDSCEGNVDSCSQLGASSCTFIASCGLSGVCNGTIAGNPFGRFQGAFDELIIYNKTFTNNEVNIEYDKSIRNAICNYTANITQANTNYTVNFSSSYPLIYAGLVGTTGRWYPWWVDSTLTNMNVSFYNETETTPSTGCTPPAINTNWIVNCSLNCRLDNTINLGTGNLTMVDIGSFTLNGLLYANNVYWTRPSSSFCRVINITNLRIT